MDSSMNQPKTAHEFREETTHQKLARLAQMRDANGPKMVKRIRLAVEIYRDKSWIDLEFNGDAARAAEVLEQDYLGELCGTVSFSKLILLCREFPDLEDWKRCKWNLQRIEAEYEKRKEERDEQTGEKEKRSKRSVTLKQFEEEEKKRKDAEYVAERLKNDVDNKDRLIAQLREDNERLRMEVSTLRGRLEELEKISKR